MPLPFSINRKIEIDHQIPPYARAIIAPEFPEERNHWAVYHSYRDLPEQPGVFLCRHQNDSMLVVMRKVASINVLRRLPIPRIERDEHFFDEAMLFTNGYSKDQILDDSLLEFSEESRTEEMNEIVRCYNIACRTVALVDMREIFKQDSLETLHEVEGRPSEKKKLKEAKFNMVRVLLAASAKELLSNLPRNPSSV